MRLSLLCWWWILSWRFLLYSWRIAPNPLLWTKNGLVLCLLRRLILHFRSWSLVLEHTFNLLWHRGNIIHWFVIIWQRNLWLYLLSHFPLFRFHVVCLIWIILEIRRILKWLMLRRAICNLELLLVDIIHVFRLSSRRVEVNRWISSHWLGLLILILTLVVGCLS